MNRRGLPAAAVALVLALAATIWRRLLWRTTVIAITGSDGKTTAKECLAAILEQRAPTLKTALNNNGRLEAPRTLLRVRPWRHRFAVIEVGLDRGGGQLARASWMLRPDVVWIVSVAQSHSNKLRSEDEIARAKAGLLRFASRRGVAVLNADDARVAAMASRAPGRVLHYGRASAADVRADAVSSRWPERLRFTAHAGGESAAVATRLVGEHWLASALGALAAARACGVGLAESAAALATVSPFPGRMEPVTLPGGAVVLRDDFKGSAAGFRVAMKVLGEARAARRIAVVGHCSDLGRERNRGPAHFVADLAVAHADVAVFVGPYAGRAAERAVRSGMAPESVHHAESPADSAELMARVVRPGDVVLLKGERRLHLARLFFAQFGPVACRLASCERQMLCDTCGALGARPQTGDPFAGIRAFQLPEGR